MPIITPETIAMPFALVWLLTMLLQYVKPLLESYVPGFAVTSANHDRNLRVLYGVLAFAAVGGYVLATMPMPSTVDGWLMLVYAVANTAGAVTFGGHITYKAIASGGASAPTADSSDPSAPGDYPPGFTSFADAGLPTTPDSADVSQQPTAPVPAAAA